MAIGDKQIWVLGKAKLMDTSNQFWVLGKAQGILSSLVAIPIAMYYYMHQR